MYSIFSFKSIFKKEEYIPTPIGIFTNPNFLIRSNLAKCIKKTSPILKGNLLDFGCGSKPYESFFNVDSYTGVDIEVSGHNHKESRIDFYYNGSKLPFSDNSFDSIFSSEVFEHVFNLEEILFELKRVLKPDGQMLITVPFVWEEHEIPYDYQRFTSYGISNLMKKNNFEIIYSEKSGNFTLVLFQLFISYIYQLIPGNGKIKRYLALFYAPIITGLGLLVNIILPKNRLLYFNNILVVKNIKEQI